MRLKPRLAPFVGLLLALAASSILADSPGGVDPTFAVGYQLGGQVYQVAPQPDGHVVVLYRPGASTTNLNPSNSIRQLDANGTLVQTFGSGGFAAPLTGVPTSLAVQPADGKIVYAGRRPDTGLVVPVDRLNADGTRDTTFQRGAFLTESGAGNLYAVALQGDGKILVGGNFREYNGLTAPGLVRLNATGTLDTTFFAATSGREVLSGVLAIVVQPTDGKIVVAGNFQISGNTQGGVARYNADGTRDTTFAFVKLGSDNSALGLSIKTSLAVLADGNLLVTGFFHATNGVTQYYASRLLAASGALDTGFAPVFDAAPLSLAVQPADGKIVVGGGFVETSIDDYNRSRGVARLNADGTKDASFDIGTGPSTGGGSPTINSVALQPDGKVLVGGAFGSFNGASMQNVVRLYGSATPADGSLLVPGSANPYLAGLPAGTTASGGDDTAPAQSPVLVPNLTLNPNVPLNFAVAGSVSNDPNTPPTSGPDGGPYNGQTFYQHLAENSFPSIIAPINSLLGVFLSSESPDPTIPNDATVDYSDAASTGGTDAASYQPALGTIFFIGDGKTTDGTPQNIFPPAGATRLFLGTFDGNDYFNNQGQFSVVVTSGTGTPNPDPTPTPTPNPNPTPTPTPNPNPTPTPTPTPNPTPTPTPTPVPNTPVLTVNADDFSYTVKNQPSSGVVVPGDVVTYKLTVRNTGRQPASAVIVRASFDDKLTKFQSASNGGTLTDGNGTPTPNIVNWRLSTLANGDHADLTYTVKVKEGADTRSGLTAGAAAQSATAAAPAVAASLGNVPGISLRVVPLFNVSTQNDGPSTVAGGPLTFTFNVVNRGTTTVTNATVDVSLPLGYTKANFKTATFVDDQGNPVGTPYKLGATLDNGQVDPAAVRLYIDSLAPGASRRFVLTVNVPYNAEPGSTVTLPLVALNGTLNGSRVNDTQANYSTRISTAAPAAPPTLGLFKLTPTAANLAPFLASAQDRSSLLYKSAQQLFLALALYTNRAPEDLEALTADQLALLLNPYVSRDVDPDSGDPLFDVPSPNSKQPSPAVTYFLLYLNTGGGDAAGITITDTVPAKLALDRSSVTFKGAADLKANTVGADGRSLTFTFGKIKKGTGGLIIYKARVPAPENGGPGLGDVIDPTTAVLLTDGLSSQAFYTPAESLLVTGKANALVDASQADLGDGTSIYSIYYRNTGGQKSRDFLVVSQVPTGGAFVSADFLDIGQSARAADTSKPEFIEKPAIGATTGRVVFHLGKVKPRQQGFVQVRYRVTAAALAQKPAGLIHHYYVAGGSFPDATTNAMRAGRPIPRWAQESAKPRTRLAHGRGGPRFSLGDVTGIFKQGLDNVTHAVGSLFGQGGSPAPAGPVAPTVWLQRIAPLSVQEGGILRYTVTVGNSGKVPAYIVTVAVYVPDGATFVSTSQGTYFPGSNSILYTPSSLPPGEAQTFTVDLRATAAAGRTIESSDCNLTAFGDNSFNAGTGAYHVGRTSTLVYSAAQARNFGALQTSIVSNAAQAGGIDPGALAAGSLYASRVAAITPNSVQTTIAHADYYATINGLTLVATGGGNLVASGGGNLIAAGAGNLVAAGAGNLVATGGGNLTFNNVPGFGPTVTAAALFSPVGAAKLVAAGAGNLVATGGGNLVAAGAGNLVDLNGSPFALSALTNATTYVAGLGNAQSLGLISQDGSGLIGQDGGGLISQDGSGLIGQDGGSLQAVGGGAALIGQDGGGFLPKAAGGARHPRAGAVKAGTLLGSPVNSVSLNFNNAGGMVFGVGGSRANDQ